MHVALAPERRWIDIVRAVLIKLGAWLIDGFATGGLALYPMFWEAQDQGGHRQRLIQAPPARPSVSPSETAAARWGMARPSLLARWWLTTRREAQRRQSIAAFAAHAQRAAQAVPELALEPQGWGSDRPTGLRSRS